MERGFQLSRLSPTKPWHELHWCTGFSCLLWCSWEMKHFIYQSINIPTLTYGHGLCIMTAAGGSSSLNAGSQDRFPLHGGWAACQRYRQEPEVSFAGNHLHSSTQSMRSEKCSGSGYCEDFVIKTLTKLLPFRLFHVLHLHWIRMYCITVCVSNMCQMMPC